MKWKDQRYGMDGDSPVIRWGDPEGWKEDIKKRGRPVISVEIVTWNLYGGKGLCEEADV